jgi:hypothetical protein
MKKKCYFVINTEKSGPDLGLATRDPDVKDIPVVNSISLALSLPPLFQM